VGNFIKNLLIFGGGMAVLVWLVAPLMFPGKTSGRINTDNGQRAPAPKLEIYREGNTIVHKHYYQVPAGSIKR
jgi:hypothetical protein